MNNHRSHVRRQSVKNAPPNAPLHPWPWPTKPLQCLHANFAGPFHGRTYLLITDAHSKWPNINEMSSTTASRTVDELHKLFSSDKLSE